MLPLRFHHTQWPVSGTPSIFKPFELGIHMIIAIDVQWFQCPKNVYVDVYIYKYIYIYIYKYIYIYIIQIYIYICIQISISISLYIYVCMCMYVYVCVCMCIYIILYNYIIIIPDAPDFAALPHPLQLFASSPGSRSNFGQFHHSCSAVPPPSARVGLHDPCHGRCHNWCPTLKTIMVNDG